MTTQIITKTTSELFYYKVLKKMGRQGCSRESSTGDSVPHPKGKGWRKMIQKRAYQKKFCSQFAIKNGGTESPATVLVFGRFSTSRFCPPFKLMAYWKWLIFFSFTVQEVNFIVYRHNLLP